MEELATTDPERAADALRAGRLAVLPTETVYGLGARAADPGAVARVYAVKGRPADHPLIVHLPTGADLVGWAVDVPDYARRLAQTFWPGPLTLVLRRGPRTGLHVTGGTDTVGLRVPDHSLTLEVLRQLGEGVAAPSANLFGQVSPTTAGHVLDEIGQRLVPGLDVVLDGGPSRVGVESTIVDATGAAPRLLRPGAVTPAQVEATAGVAVSLEPSPVRAPGTLAAHYAPRAQVLLVSSDVVQEHDPWQGRPTRGLLAPAHVATPPGLVRLSAPVDEAAYAAVLYSALREADALRLRSVIVVPPAGPGLAEAIRDRLTRAAHGSGAS
jgi:L-threonylcarbamoyladenylate synthase